MTAPSNRQARAAASSCGSPASVSAGHGYSVMKRRIVDRLDDLYRLDRPAYRALVRAMRDVLTHERRRGR